jgi:hypothetical protein
MDDNEFIKHIEIHLKETENISNVPVCFCLNIKPSEIIILNVKIKDIYGLSEYEKAAKKGNTFKKTIYFYNFENLNCETKKIFMRFCIENDIFVLNFPDRFWDKGPTLPINVPVSYCANVDPVKYTRQLFG